MAASGIEPMEAVAVDIARCHNLDQVVAESPNDRTTNLPEDFRHDIEQLCRDIGLGEARDVLDLGRTADAQQRIIEISLQNDNAYPLLHLYLPDPSWHNFDSSKLQDHVQVRNHLSATTSLPISNVVAYDSTMRNVLGRPFICQVPNNGQVLHDIYADLPLSEKLDITKTLADLLISMRQNQFDKPGFLHGNCSLPRRCNLLSKDLLGIDALLPSLPGFYPQDAISQPKQPLSKIITYLLYQRQHEEDDFAIYKNRRIKLREVTDQMREVGLFRVEDDQNFFAIADLNSHDILIQRISTASPRNTFDIAQVPTDISHSWVFSELNYCNKAKALPVVLSCAPPTWLWDRGTDSAEKTHLSGAEELLAGEQLLIKACFDDLMSKFDPNYIDDAYVRGPWLRELYYLSTQTFLNGNLEKEYTRFMQRWEEFYQSLCLIHFSLSDDEDEEGDDNGTEVEADEAVSSNPSCSSASVVEEWGESMITYRAKIEELCRNIGLPSPIEMEDIQKGGNNRIFILKFAGHDVDDLILRVPWFESGDDEDSSIADQVAVLQYLSSLDRLPLASVIAYDLKTANALNSQYVMQARLSGSTMEATYHTLPLDARLGISTQVARVIAKMESLAFSKCGRLVRGRDLESASTTAVKINTIAIAGLEANSTWDFPAVPFNSLLSFIDSLFETHKLQYHMVPSIVKRCWRFQQIAKHMEMAGLISDCDMDRVVMWHWDFAPRNILIGHDHDTNGPSPGTCAAPVIDSTSTETVTSLSEIDVPDTKFSYPWKITGIVDWDDVKAMPRVVTRTPPTWLWFNEAERYGTAWYGDYEAPLPRPLDAEELIVKAHFDEEIAKLCPDYMEEAYGRGFWLRSIIKLGVKGFASDMLEMEADTFEKAWSEYLENPGLSEKTDMEIPSSALKEDTGEDEREVIYTYPDVVESGEPEVRNGSVDGVTHSDKCPGAVTRGQR